MRACGLLGHDGAGRGEGKGACKLLGRGGSGCREGEGREATRRGGPYQTADDGRLQMPRNSTSTPEGKGKANPNDEAERPADDTARLSLHIS